MNGRCFVGRLTCATLFIGCMAGLALAQTRQVVTATERALEDQLNCHKSPDPGPAIRAMLENGLLSRTPWEADGIPIFAPKVDLIVFGNRVLFVSGWQLEGGELKFPFSRGPGTAPPRFLSVILDAQPDAVPYAQYEIRSSDGLIATPSFSSKEKANEYYVHSGTNITCYGEG